MAPQTLLGLGVVWQEWQPARRAAERTIHVCLKLPLLFAAVPEAFYAPAPARSPYGRLAPACESLCQLPPLMQAGRLSTLLAINI
jgi:hypothetical protein